MSLPTLHLPARPNVARGSRYEWLAVAIAVAARGRPVTATLGADRRWTADPPEAAPLLNDVFGPDADAPSTYRPEGALAARVAGVAAHLGGTLELPPAAEDTPVGHVL